MHGLRRAVALLLGLTAVTSPLRAQTDRDDRWQIALENGEYIWDIRLVRLTGDSLVFRRFAAGSPRRHCRPDGKPANPP